MDLKELSMSIDIVEYISQFVDLEQRGEEFWGLSPFKPEKTPSFSVRRENGSWFDFASGKGGNLYTFVRLYNNCSPKEAVNLLEQYAGISLSDGSVGKKNKRLEATNTCKRFSAKETARRSPAVGNKPLRDTCMERYENNDSKLAVWMAEGISKETLDKFCVKYDSFSNRLVYPIRDLTGKIVNIGGRTLDPSWKERGQNKYCYFYGWENGMNLVYGLYENLQDIKEAREVILFEGCKSVLIANTWGIKNCGALLTSHLNPMQLKILARLGCRVVFALDKDVRIKDDHNIEKLKRYVNVEYIWDFKDLLGEKDAPVDKGREVFAELYSNRIRYK